MKYTEEDKKVINYWKKELNNFEYTKELDLKTNNYFGQFEEKINMITGILNLLEKYQKEIEKLKEHLNQYYDGKLFTANQLRRIEKEHNKYFIHKDKIREKIKEIEERIEEENEMLELNQICKEDYESRFKYLNYALNIYKRLLGDE